MSSFLKLTNSIPTELAVKKQNLFVINLSYLPSNCNPQFAAFHNFFSNYGNDESWHPHPQRVGRDLLLKVYFQFKM